MNVIRIIFHILNAMLLFHAAYFGMNDSGSAAEVSSDGMIIPVRMTENYGYGIGDSMRIFGSEYSPNSFFIHLNGEDPQAL